MRHRLVSILLVAPFGAVIAQSPLGSAISYQGQLSEAGQPATGLYDLQACLFDGLSSPAQVACAPDMDDVPVEDGLFTVELDFGAVFDGQQRYLELRVRAGASVGSYTVLTPRQLIRPAPEALRAATSQTTPWTGLSNVPIGFADGIDNIGTGTVTSIAAGPGLTGGPITSAGTLGLATGGVQLVHIANNAVNSQRIVDGSIGRFDLAFDAINTENIANFSVTSAKIAPAAIGLVQINTTQVQARVASSCSLGSYLLGINADGSVQCAELPGITTINTLNAASQDGEYSSIVIGNDGIPMISYSDFNAGGFFHSLRLIRCINPACSGPLSSIAIDAGAASRGTFNSIAIGSDGRPVISYYDATAQALRVARCSAADCSGAITLTTVDDQANDVGRHTAIAIGGDGFPIISYRDHTARALKVAKCINVACTGATTITTLDDSANQVGEYTSIAVGPDGLAVISYYDRTAARLKVAKCSNAACTAASVVNVPYSGSDIGRFSSIAIDAAGFPVISYQDAFAGSLEVSKCTTLNCSNATRATVDAPANIVGSYTAITLLGDGSPVISYYDSTAQALKVARCSSPSCAGSAVVTTIDDSANDVGQSSAIAIGADGLPVISYRDITAGSLKLAKCGSRSCR